MGRLDAVHLEPAAVEHLDPHAAGLEPAGQADAVGAVQHGIGDELAHQQGHIVDDRWRVALPGELPSHGVPSAADALDVAFEGQLPHAEPCTAVAWDTTRSTMFFPTASVLLDPYISSAAGFQAPFVDYGSKAAPPPAA